MGATHLIQLKVFAFQASVLFVDVRALARPAFANDCDDAMRCRLAASRARPFSLSGCSAVGCAFACTFAASVVPATICIDSADELAMMRCVRSQKKAQSAQHARS